MLIQTKAVEKFGIGRFGVTFNDFDKVVYIQTLWGKPPAAYERDNLEKIIRVKRPDIFGSGGILTGWAIEFPMPLGGVRATTSPTM